MANSMIAEQRWPPMAPPAQIEELSISEYFKFSDQY